MPVPITLLEAVDCSFPFIKLGFIVRGRPSLRWGASLSFHLPSFAPTVLFVVAAIASTLWTRARIY